MATKKTTKTAKRATKTAAKKPVARKQATIKPVKTAAPPGSYASARPTATAKADPWNRLDYVHDGLNRLRERLKASPMLVHARKNVRGGQAGQAAAHLDAVLERLSEGYRRLLD